MEKRSTWPDWGRWQYSQRLPARITTEARVAASITSNRRGVLPQREAGLGFQHGENVADEDVALEFAAFVRSEGAGVRFAREFGHAGVIVFRVAELEQRLG